MAFKVLQDPGVLLELPVPLVKQDQQVLKERRGSQVQQEL